MPTVSHPAKPNMSQTFVHPASAVVREPDLEVVQVIIKAQLRAMLEEEEG